MNRYPKHTQDILDTDERYFMLKIYEADDKVKALIWGLLAVGVVIYLLMR